MKSDYEKGYELWQKVAEQNARRENRIMIIKNIFCFIGGIITAGIIAVAMYYLYIALWAMFGN